MTAEAVSAVGRGPASAAGEPSARGGSGSCREGCGMPGAQTAPTRTTATPAQIAGCSDEAVAMGVTPFPVTGALGIALAAGGPAARPAAYGRERP